MRARLALLVLLAGAGPAMAEPKVLPADSPAAAEMLAFSRTEAYRKLLAGAVARVPAAVLARCPKLAFDDGAIFVQQPPQFTADKAIVGGAWRHSQLAHGCGADVVLSFFFYATPERRVLTVLGAPGNTRTDLMQQRTARTFALVALDPVAHGCASFETVNTKFEGFGTRTPEVKDPGPDSPVRPWWETWTMLGCGKHYSVPLNFTPNRLGLSIVQPGGIETR